MSGSGILSLAASGPGALCVGPGVGGRRSLRRAGAVRRALGTLPPLPASGVRALWTPSVGPGSLSQGPTLFGGTSASGTSSALACNLHPVCAPSPHLSAAFGPTFQLPSLSPIRQSSGAPTHPSNPIHYFFQDNPPKLIILDIYKNIILNINKIGKFIEKY